MEDSKVFTFYVFGTRSPPDKNFQIYFLVG